MYNIQKPLILSYLGKNMLFSDSDIFQSSNASSGVPLIKTTDPNNWNATEMTSNKMHADMAEDEASDSGPEEDSDEDDSEPPPIVAPRPEHTKSVCVVFICI